MEQAPPDLSLEWPGKTEATSETRTRRIPLQGPFVIRPTEKTLRALDQLLLLRVCLGWLLFAGLWRLCI
jgi:hypothetical protein